MISLDFRVLYCNIFRVRSLYIMLRGAARCLECAVPLWWVMQSSQVPHACGPVLLSEL